MANIKVASRTGHSVVFLLAGLTVVLNPPLALGQTGACCDNWDGSCADGVEEGNCTGVLPVWTDGVLCAELSPPCIPVGACCDEYTGLCTDFEFEADCTGVLLTWTATTMCTSVTCDELPKGACCNTWTGVCTDDSVEILCDGTFDEWSEGILCANLDPACLPHGACCNEDTGVCTNTVLEGDCQGFMETWTASTLCGLLSPACAVAPTGACCGGFDGECDDDVYEVECQGALDVWHEGVTCLSLDPACSRQPPTRVIELRADTGNGTGPYPIPGVGSPWIDMSGNAHHAALTNFIGDVTSGWQGDGTLVSPYRLLFDGTDDRVTIPGGTVPELQSTSHFTMTLWFRAGNDVTTHQYLTEWVHEHAAPYAGMTLAIQDGILEVYNGSGFTVIGDVAPNTWYHAVVVKTPTLLECYLNGGRTYSGAGPNVGDQVSEIVIGAGTWAGPGAYARPYAGEIAQWSVFQGAMEMDEVSAELLLDASLYYPDVPITALVGLRPDTADGALPYPIPGASSPWVDLIGTHDAALVSFDGDAASGWQGDGSVVSPYRLLFDGVDDHAAIPGATVSALEGVEAASVGLWFETGANVAIDQSLFEWVEQYAAPFPGMRLGVSGGNLRVDLNVDPGGWVDVATVAPGTWYHVVVAKELGQARVYVNGQLAHTSGSINLGDQVSEIVLGVSTEGGDGVYSDWFGGALGPVYVWEGALDDTEVLTEYGIDSATYHPRGACCDITDGTCTDNLLHEECGGVLFEWTPDVLCGDLDPPCSIQPTGSCCNGFDGVCLDDVYEVECQDVSPRAPSLWTEGVACLALLPPCTESPAEKLLELRADEANGTGPHSVPGADSPWVDVTGNGHDGTLEGVDGDANGGWLGDGSPQAPYRLRLDGANDHITMPGGSVPELDSSRSISVEMWYRTENPTTGYLLEWLELCAPPYWGMSINMAGGNLQVYDNPWVSVASGIQPNTWYHFVIVEHGRPDDPVQGIEVYVDGVNTYASDWSNWGRPIGDIGIGSNGAFPSCGRDWSGYSNGSFGEFSVWWGPMSYAQVQAEYQADRGVYNAIGACCNGSTGSCQDGVAVEDCQGPMLIFTQDTACAELDPLCAVVPAGACCDWWDGACADGVAEANCTGTDPTWTEGATCASLDPACAPRGACCDGTTGTCVDDQFEADCGAPTDRWEANTACAAMTPPCATLPVGACCDTTVGGCADDLYEVDCTGPALEWTDGTLCGDLDPPCALAATGACCDVSDGSCTDDVFEIDCQGGSLGWTGETLCADLDPPCVKAAAFKVIDLRADMADGALPYGSPGADSPWVDLAGGDSDGALLNVAGDASSGWQGTGVPTDPYRLKLDAADDQGVRIPGTSVPEFASGVDAYSAAVWFKLDDPAGSYESIFEMCNPLGTPWAGLSLAANGGGLALWRCGAWLEQIVTLEAGRWYHVAATKERNVAVRVYVDGQLVQEVLAPDPEVTVCVANSMPNPIALGQSSNSLAAPTREMSGAFGQAALWLGALDASEVLADYLADKWLYSTCVQSEDCDDGNPCTTGTCVDDACVFTPGDCDDGDACTSDVCDAELGCIYTPIDPVVDCDDTNACTVESCDPGTGCVNTPLDPVVDCDDTNACTVESCDPGAGCVNTPIDPVVDCDDLNSCTIESCDPASGCVHTPVDCDDTDACTIDSCDTGTGDCDYTAVDCDDSDPCTVDTCDPVTGCVNTPFVCDDGLWCNGVETCVGGGCQAGTDPCPGQRCDEAQDACTDALMSCQLARDTVPPDRSVGLDLLLEDAANIRGYQTSIAITRTSGTGTLAVSCPDGVDVDETRADYLFFGLDTLLAFDCESLVASSTLTYVGGANVGGSPAYLAGYTLNASADAALDSTFEITLLPYIDSALSDPGGDPLPFAVGPTCLLTVGGCQDHMDCDDGEWCNGPEQCVDLLCMPGTPPDCGDGVGCTDDSCDEFGDACVHTPVDGNCNDGIGCTTDTCDALSDCQFTPDDGLCDDSIPCTVDSCDALSDCQFTPDDALCGNGAFCDGEEVCDDFAGCQDVADPCIDLAHCDEDGDVCLACINDGECDDDIPCTINGCDLVTYTCLFTPSDPDCSNGEYCDGEEVCDALVGCQVGTMPCGDLQHCDEANDICLSCVFQWDCDDGNYCNGSEQCTNNVCEAGIPPDLTDAVACTVDTCDEVNDLVVHTPDDALCDNGQFCDGLESCDALLDCQAGVPQQLDDSVACTIDTCDEVSDVVEHTPDDAFCSNGLFCDGPEVCDALADCQSGTPPDLNDNVACTVDTCDETDDVVVHTPDDGFCDNTLYCDGVETCDELTDCQDNPDPCIDLAHCDEVADVCLSCIADGECDDGEYCNGFEICTVNVCEDGPPPVLDDGVECTVDACDDVLDVVTHTAIDAACDNAQFCDGVEVCDEALGCVAIDIPCQNAVCLHCLEDPDECEWCIMDMNRTGFVDGLDYGFFSGCFGAAYGAGDPCLTADFDGDGIVGTGDFAPFAGCFSLDCMTCNNCRRPDWMIAASTGRPSSEGVVAVQLVAVKHPGERDFADVLPASVSDVGVGLDFHLEIWASHRMRDGSADWSEGLASVYGTLSFDPARVAARSVSSGTPFSSLSYGAIDAVQGRIESLGGCATPGVTDLGVSSQWVRVAIVTMRPLATGTTDIRIESAGSVHGVSIVNEFGNTDEAQIEFGRIEIKVHSWDSQRLGRPFKRSKTPVTGR